MQLLHTNSRRRRPINELSLALTLISASLVEAQTPQRERVQTVRVMPQEAMPDSLRLRLSDSLAAGRARWRDRGPTSYEIAVTVGCFCSPETGRPQHPVVSVRNAHVVAVRSASAREAQRALLVWKRWTVDSLFAYAERELRDQRRAVNTLVLMHGRFPARDGLFESTNCGLTRCRPSRPLRRANVKSQI